MFLFVFSEHVRGAYLSRRFSKSYFIERSIAKDRWQSIDNQVGVNFFFRGVCVGRHQYSPRRFQETSAPSCGSLTLANFLHRCVLRERIFSLQAVLVTIVLKFLFWAHRFKNTRCVLWTSTFRNILYFFLFHFQQYNWCENNLSLSLSPFLFFGRVRYPWICSARVSSCGRGQYVSSFVYVFLAE